MFFVGQVIGGGYRLDERLHAGGACAVWAATEGATQRPVALKILADDLAAQPSFVSLFVQRGRVAARALHPSIVSVETIGRTERGVPFLVLPLLRGMTLRSALDTEGLLPAERAVTIMRQVLEGLAEAHEQGSPHGNLSPGNIFLTASGEPGPPLRILNFGLSRAMLAPADATTPERILGPLDYLPPELLRRPGAPPTPAADVFACGIITTEMLIGQPPLAPLRPDDHAVEAKLADRNGYYLSGSSVPAPSTTLPTLSSALDDVIRRATHTSPGGRFGDAARMLSSFRSATSSGAVLLETPASPAGGPPPRSDTLRSNDGPSTQLYSLDDGRPSIDTDVDGPHRDSDLTVRNVDDGLGLGEPPSLTTNVMTVKPASLPKLSEEEEEEDTVETTLPHELAAPGGSPRQALADPFESTSGSSEPDTTNPFHADTEPAEEPPPGYAKTMLFDPAAVKPPSEAGPATEPPPPLVDLPPDPTQIFVPPGEAPSTVAAPPGSPEPAPGIGGAKTQILDPDAIEAQMAPRTQILEPDAISGQLPMAPARPPSAGPGASYPASPVPPGPVGLDAPASGAGAYPGGAFAPFPGQAGPALTGRSAWAQAPVEHAPQPKPAGRSVWLLLLLLGMGGLVALAALGLVVLWFLR